MKRKIKNILVNLALVSISLLVALLIGEAVIRALYKDQMVLFPRYHTHAAYNDFKIRRTRPNMAFRHTSIDGRFHFQTNSKGLRNDEDIDYSKEPDEIRVLCIGDSNTFGYEVDQEQTYSAVLERLLKEKGYNATVLNAGVSGFSTAEALVLLENEGVKYQPDYVVLGFFNNDFSDNIRSDLFRIEGDTLVVNRYEYLPGVEIQNFIYSFGIIHFLGENSYLYNYMFNTVWDFYKNLSTEKAKEEHTEYAIEVREEFSPYEIDLMKALVARMRAFTQSRRMSLIILDVPQFGMSSSIPEELVDHFRAHSDTLFYANDMLGEYELLARTHVPNGHRHISEESHALLGEKIAQDILSGSDSVAMDER